MEIDNLKDLKNIIISFATGVSLTFTAASWAVSSFLIPITDMPRWIQNEKSLSEKVDLALSSSNLKEGIFMLNQKNIICEQEKQELNFKLSKEYERNKKISNKLKQLQDRCNISPIEQGIPPNECQKISIKLRKISHLIPDNIGNWRVDDGGFNPIANSKISSSDEHTLGELDNGVPVITINTNSGEIFEGEIKLIDRPQSIKVCPQ